MVVQFMYYIVGILSGGPMIRLAATRTEAEEQATKMILAGAKNVKIKRIG